MPSTIKLPDPVTCKTWPIAANVWECLVRDPRLCPHVLGFGYSYYCKHSCRQTFEAKEKPGRRNHGL